MKKDIIDIVAEKEFMELTSEERTELNEFCANEQEYNQLKNVLLNVSSLKVESVTPRKETKASLDRLFDTSFPRSAPLWQSSVLAAVIPRNKPLYMQPLMHIAAVALLLILVVPMFQKEINTTKTPIAKIENNNTEQLIVPLKQEQKDVETQTENTAVPIPVEKEANEIEEESVPIRSDLDFSGISVSDNLPVVAGSGFSEVSVTDHPDGVFSGDLETEVAFSQPASASEDLLDLLTATF